LVSEARLSRISELLEERSWIQVMCFWHKLGNLIESLSLVPEQQLLNLGTHARIP